MVPPQLFFFFFFFKRERFFFFSELTFFFFFHPGVVVEVREKKKGEKLRDRPHHLKKKRQNRKHSQGEVHPGLDAQRVVDERQRLEPGHEPPRVAAVVAHREELPSAHVAEQALEREVAVLGEGEAVDGVGGEERVLFFSFFAREGLGCGRKEGERGE